MGFFDNVLENFNIKDLPKEPPFKAVIYGDYAGYFMGVAGIKRYTREEINLSLKKGAVTVKGEELTIGKFCGGDVMICGKITSVERS